MSGFGIEVIAGLLIGAVALGGAVILGGLMLAGGAIFLAGKGAIAAGKGIYHAHQRAEAERLRKARAELEAVRGETGKLAAERLDLLKKTEEALAAEYLSAVDARERRLDAAQADLEGSKAKLEEVAARLPAFFERRQAEIEQAVEAEVTAFSKSLDKVCSKMMDDISVSMAEKQKSVMDQLDRASTELEARKLKYHDYALSTKLSVDALLAALERSYACGEVVPAELAAARQTAQQIDQLLRAGDEASLRAAAMMAGTYEERVLVLQVLAEQRTASAGHQKAVLQAKSEELKKMTEATADLKADCKDGFMEEFFEDGKDAAFWSQGRLPALWAEAEELRKRAEKFSAQMGEEAAAILAAEMDRKNLEIQQEHARTRSFLLSRLYMGRMAGDIVESMEDQGWELAEDPAYQANEEGEPDPRMPVQLRFRRDDDEKTVIIYDEYDEEKHQYVQKVIRMANEAGQPDEEERHAEDAALSEAMNRRGHKGFSLKCDQSTAGMKKTV